MAAAQLDRPTGLYAGFRRTAAPFTRAVLAADRPTIKCYAGRDAWFRARAWATAYFGGATLLPPDADPEGISWPVSNREVLVCAPGVMRERLDALLAALIRDGAVQAIAAQRFDGRGAGPEDRGRITVLYAKPEVATDG